MSTVTPPTTDVDPEGSQSATDPVANERSYRYPGSPPFRDIDIDRLLFKGRDEEAKKVFHSILSSDLFLLYAVSGMGKSSLLNAGVMHRLRARGYWPVSVRLNETESSAVESIDRQIAAVDLRDTEVEVLRTPGLDFDITADTTLWDLLGSLEVWRDDRLQQLVVVLDQFEELFTLDWNDDVRRRFITQFGEVVRGHRSADGEGVADASIVPVPNVKFCIVIREDALGELESLADDVPQIMQNRFRLGALDATQAEAAIREPAMVADGALDTQPFRYSEDAAHQILSFLQETEHATTTGIGEANAASSVDPSQLQIICQYIERRVLTGKDDPPPGEVVTIDAADLGGTDGLRGVLGDFYRRTIGTIPQATQRSVQHLCEDGLISKSGRRLSLEREEIDEQYGVAPAVLDELVDQRLLRVEPRVGSEYYELSHDTLVAPILADRADRRKARSRRRRRFVFIAAGAVALLVLGLLAYRLGFDDGSESVAALEFEGVLSGSVDEPGDVERFRFIGRAEPSVVVVQPTGAEMLDAELEVTNSSKKRRRANQLESGGAERIVVPAGDSERLDVTVSSEDASTGSFDITTSRLEVTPLSVDPDSEPIGGSIDEPGAIAVYSVAIADQRSVGGEESAIEIIVTSGQPAAEDSNDEPKAGAKEELGLDAEIDVIDPTGVGSSIDLKAAGDGERVIVGGAAGEYLVIVRDHLAGTGPFEITATTVDYTALPADDSAAGEVTASDVAVAFAIDVPANSLVGLDVQPDAEFDPVVEIVDPLGTTVEVDSLGAGGAEEALVRTTGRNLVRITGFDGDVGNFEVVTTSIQAQQITEGQTVTADAPAAFIIDVSSDQFVAVRPANELDPVVDTFDPVGARSSVDSSGAGGAEVALLRGAGEHVVIVGGFEGSVGSFEIATAPVESQELAAGESVTATTPAVFDVDAAMAQVLGFIAVPADAKDVLSVELTGPDGLVLGVGSAEPGDPATAFIDGTVPGRFQIVVTSPDIGSDITATLDPADGRQLVADDPLTGTTPVEFEVEVTGDERFMVTARPVSADIVLDLQVLDSDGFFSASGSSPAAGEPATVSVVGDPGTYRIQVFSSGEQTDVTAVLQAIPVEPFGLGVAAASTPAAFDVDVIGDERLLVIVTPQAGSALTLEIVDPDGDTSFPYSPGSGDAVVSLLTGDGTHRVWVTASESASGGEPFTIETRPLPPP